MNRVRISSAEQEAEMMDKSRWTPEKEREEPTQESRWTVAFEEKKELEPRQRRRTDDDRAKIKIKTPESKF